jgi:hypothetical protein
MSAAIALRVAHTAGIRLSVDGNELIMQANSPPSQTVIDILSRNRAGLLALLRSANDDQPADDRRFELDERAAIIEHYGCIPREWVEGFARLNPACPPARMSPKRWRAVIDAVGEFLDQWVVRAAALGWTPQDLFGADSICPEVSWLNSGPLWFGDGSRIIEINADSLVIETKSGARLTHYRKAHMRHRVLPWELDFEGAMS